MSAIHVPCLIPTDGVAESQRQDTGQTAQPQSCSTEGPSQGSDANQAGLNGSGRSVTAGQTLSTGETEQKVATAEAARAEATREAAREKADREAAAARSRHTALPKPKRQSSSTAKASPISALGSDRRKPDARTQPFTGF